MKSGRTMTSAVSETSVGSVYAGPIFFFLPILMCIADDTKCLFFRIVPPPSAGEQYTTKLGFFFC